MAYFLVTVYFKLEDGTKIDRSGWYQGEDYIDACEAARLDRAWDLREIYREGEFRHPERVVSAQLSAKRYNVQPHPQDDDLVLGIGQSLRPTRTLMGDHAPYKVVELPGATREDIDRLPS